MSDEQKLEVTEALAKEMGLETDSGDTGGSELLDGFYEQALAEAGKVAEQPETVAAPESEESAWVHEPTGKTFDNEVDYLRFDSGYNNDKWGKRFQELEDRLAKAETGGEQSAQEAPSQQAPDKAEVMKAIWDNVSEDTLKEPFAEFVYQGLDKATQFVTNQFEARIGELSERLETVTKQLETERVYSENGVSRAREAELLKTHSWLSDIGDPSKRAAAMKALSQNEGRESGSPKLMDKATRLKAEDHVEGSAGMSMPEDGGLGSFEKKLLGASDKDRLRAFGQMFSDNKDLSHLLKGDF